MTAREQDEKGENKADKKEWKSFGVGVTKVWQNDKIGKSGIRMYNGLRISLNCLVTDGMSFTKTGGKQSSVR